MVKIRKDSVSGMVKFLYTGWNLYICLFKMMLLLWTDEEESRVQGNGVYVRSNRNTDSVLEIKMKRLSSQNWMRRVFKCPV